MNIFYKLMFVVFSLMVFFAGQDITAAAEHSGFLEDYSGLVPDTDQPGALIYRKEGEDLESYSKMMIVPIETAFDPASSGGPDRVTTFHRPCACDLADHGAGDEAR